MIIEIYKAVFLNYEFFHKMIKNILLIENSTQDIKFKFLKEKAKLVSDKRYLKGIKAYSVSLIVADVLIKVPSTYFINSTSYFL